MVGRFCFGKSLTGMTSAGTLENFLKEGQEEVSERVRITKLEWKF